MEDIRYVYTVNPRRPIRGIAGIKSIRTGTTLKLTKEEVKIAMKSGHVYRRFANEGINQRVTGENLDRLHNEKFMSEKEYKEFLNESTEEIKSSVDSKVEEPSVETQEPVKNTPVEEKIPEHIEDNTEKELNSEVKEADVINNNAANLEVKEENENKVDIKDVEQTDKQENTEVSVSEETITEDSDPEMSEEDSDEDESDDEQVAQSNEGNSQSPVIYYGGGKKKNKKHRN